MLNLLSHLSLIVSHMSLLSLIGPPPGPVRLTMFPLRHRRPPSPATHPIPSPCPARLVGFARHTLLTLLAWFARLTRPAWLAPSPRTPHPACLPNLTPCASPPPVPLALPPLLTPRQPPLGGVWSQGRLAQWRAVARCVASSSERGYRGFRGNNPDSRMIRATISSWR
jgi:hypothetical protein